MGSNNKRVVSAGKTRFQLRNAFLFILQSLTDPTVSTIDIKPLRKHLHPQNTVGFILFSCCPSGPIWFPPVLF